ncbi:MAG: hypothetical protein LBQ58_04360 [Synergistaceae bacterium]|nr:hypothetical protein [Synergistaceae bacterium]
MKKIALLCVFVISVFVFCTADSAFAASAGDAVFGKAVGFYKDGKMSDAAKSFGSAGDAYLKEKNKAKAAQSYYFQGQCLSANSQPQPALEAFKKAETQYEAAGDNAGLCKAIFFSAQLCLDAMEWDEAKAYYD